MTQPSWHCTIALLGALLLPASESAATVITFDQTDDDFLDLLDEGGFRVESDSAFFIGGATFCSPDCPDNGTHILMLQDGWVALRLRSLDGAPFALRSVELGETFVIFPGPTSVLIRGFTPDGAIVEQSVTLDQVNDGTGPLIDLQLVELPGEFQLLDHAEFVVPPPPLVGWHRYSIDNIVVEGAGPIAVPALSGWGAALLMALLAVLGARTLRRHHVASRSA